MEYKQGEKIDQNGADPMIAGTNGSQEKTGTNKNADSTKQESAQDSLSEYKPKITLAGHVEPTYYIGGGNGNAMIEEVLNDLGWRRIRDKLDESYTLKWCELKQAINYNAFREAEQMVNHIPNCNLLTNKLGLLNTLQEYDRVYGSMKKRVPKLDFMPETYKLDEAKERDLFRDKWKDGEVWICKPTGRNQGKGIFLVKSKEEVDQLIQESDERNQQQQLGKIHRPINRIIQRYIHNPLLLNNKKFDIRAYMLIASTSPYLVLYHKGYIRLSMFEYENKYDNLAMHLTNQFIQRKDPKYKEVKEETVWTMEKLNEYINANFVSEKGLQQDWTQNVLPVRMKQIMTYCFNAVKNKFHHKVGYFDLYGFDFMIDADMKVWLIEVNVNPSLATNCAMLKDVVPAVVKETLYIVIDCFEKARKGKPVMPCHAIKTFEVLFYESGSASSKTPVRGGSPGRPQMRSRSISPVRRPHTISPNKELTSKTMESLPQGRRPFLAIKPGMKPIPTSTYSYGSKAPGLTVMSQANNNGVRSSTNLAASKSPYQERITPMKSAAKANLDKVQLSGEKQETKRSAKSNTEQKVSSKQKAEHRSAQQTEDQSKSVTSRKSSLTPEKSKRLSQDPTQRSPKTLKSETKSQVSKTEESKQAKTRSTTKQSAPKPEGKQATTTKDSAEVNDKNSTGGHKVKNSSNNNNANKSTEECKRPINTESSVSSKVIHAHGTSSKKPNRTADAEERMSRGS